MEEQVKDWRVLYLALSTGVQPLKQYVMDTITVDDVEAYRPLAWIYTSPDGLVSYKDMHRAVLTDAVETMLRLSSRKVHPYGYIIKSKSAEPLVMVTVAGKRFVLNSKSLPNIQSLYPKGLEGVTLMKYAGRSFDIRVFIYEREDTETSSDDSVRIRPRDTLEKDENSVSTTQYYTQRLLSLQRCASAVSE